MNWTPENEARYQALAGMLGVQLPPAVPEPDSFFPRLGKGLANVPSNVAEGLANAGIGAANFVTSQDADTFSPVRVPKFYDLPAAQGFGQQSADLLSGLTGAIATAAIPGGVVSRGARFLGGGGTSAAILGDVAGGAVLGASQGDAAGTASEFGLLGAANRFLPNPYLKALANAAIPVGGQLLRGHDPLSAQSLQTTGANVVVPWLLGKFARQGEEKPLMDTAETPPASEPLRLYGPRIETGYTDPLFRERPAGVPLLRDSPASGEIIEGHVYGGYTDPAAREGMSADRRFTTEEPTPVESQGPPRPLLASLPAPRTLGEAARAGDIVQHNGMWGHVVEGDDGFYVQGDEGAVRIYGKSPETPLHQVEGLQPEVTGERTPEPEPQFQRELIGRRDRAREGGFIDPGNPLLQYGAGAIAGGLAQPLLDDDPNKPIWQKAGEGALRGAGLVAAGKGLMNMRYLAGKMGEPLGVRPAPKRLLSSEPNAGAIEGAYRKLAKSTGYPDVRIADIQRESGAPLADVQSFLADQWKTGKVHLSGGEPSYLAPEQRAAHVEINGDKMFMARLPEEVPSTTLGAVAKLPDVKKALLRAADEQESGNHSVLGWIGRRLQQNFNLGKTDSTTRAEQFGKGEERLFFQKAEPIVRGLSDTTPAESKALLSYEGSARGPSDVALLRSAVRPQVADAMIAAENLEGYGQQLLAKGSGDPRKQALVDDTEGTYRTTKYKFATQPKEWIADLRTNPKLKTDLIDEFVTTNKFPGYTREEVAAQVDGFIQSKLRPEYDAGPSNPSKTDPHLWTKRKDLTDTERAFLGEYKDPAQRVAFTLQKIGSNIAQAKKATVLDEMGKSGELPIMTIPERQTRMAAARAAGDTAKVEELAGLKQVPPNPAFGVLAGKLVPHDVLDSLNAHNELWTNGWLKNFSGPTSWMKGMMTVANPATHARQWIQTPLTAAMARVAPWDFWGIGKMMRLKGPEWEEAVRNGIVHADFSAQDLSRGALEMDATFNRGKAATTWQAVKGAAQKAYGLPDNLVRLAAYYKNKPRFFAEGNAKGLKGADLESYAQNKATDFVNRYTMNYGAVANAVKVARETPFVSPFISYQAEMLRILKNLGEDAIGGSATDRVWALGNIAQLIAAPLVLAKAFESKLSDKDQKEWDRVQRLSPEYSGGQIRVPMGRNKDGSFRYVNVANLVPAGDTAALARNLASGDVRRALASNPIIGWEKTPIFNTVAEQVTGRDSVTDQKLGSAGRVMSLAKSLAPPLTPYVGYEGKRLISSFTPNADGGLGLTNSRTGRVDSPGNFLLRQAGIPLANVQPAQLLQRAKSDFAEEKRAATSELRLVTQTNATKEDRGRALLRYNEKVKGAQKRLLESLK